MTSKKTLDMATINKRASKKYAHKMYIESKGDISISKLASAANTTQKQIKEWIKKEKWDRSYKAEISDKVKASLNKVPNVDDQEEAFCFHYLKTFNKTASAVEAQYDKSEGNKIFQRKNVQLYIKHLKKLRNEETFIDVVDIINQYAKIAFADITDFVTFQGSVVKFKSYRSVDGQVIKKLSTGKDGPKMELHDKMEALKRLEKFYVELPEDVKLELEKQKVQILKDRLELEKEKVNKGVSDHSVTFNIMPASSRKKE